MNVDCKTLCCSQCNISIGSDSNDAESFVVLAHTNDLFEVWRLRQLLIKPDNVAAISAPVMRFGFLPQNRNRLRDQQIDCAIEFLCQACHTKRLQYDRHVTGYVMRMEKNYVHPDIKTLQRQISAKALPWTGSSLLDLLAKDGHPYLDAVLPVDGRELDDYKQNGPCGLLDYPGLVQLSDPLMPRSYQMYVRKAPPECFGLVSRYMRLDGFLSTISVFSVTTGNAANADTIRRALNEEVVQEEQKKDARSYNHRVLVSRDVMSPSSGRADQNTLLVTLVTEWLLPATDLEATVLSQIASGTFKPSVQKHYQIQSALQRIVANDPACKVKEVQPPLPVSRVESRIISLPASSGCSEEVEIPSLAPKQEALQVFCVNCVALTGARRSFFGVANDTNQVFHVTSASDTLRDHDYPVFPVVFQLTGNLRSHKLPGVMMQLLDML